MGVSPAPEQRRCGRSRGGGWAPLDVEAAAPAASVAVMAPALTESGPQKPENLLPPLPAGGFLSAEQAGQVCKNREVLAKFVVSASVKPSKIDEQCLRGISKDLIRDVINSSKYSNGLDSLSTYGNGADANDLIASAAVVAAAAAAAGVCKVVEDIDADEIGILGDFVESRKSLSSSSSSSNSSNSCGFTIKTSSKTNDRISNSSFANTKQNLRSLIDKSNAIEAKKPEQPDRYFIMSSDSSAGQRTDAEMGFIVTSTNDSAVSTTSTIIPESYSLTTTNMSINDVKNVEDTSKTSERHNEVSSNVLGSLETVDLPNVPGIVDDNENDEDDDKDVNLERIIGHFANEDLNVGVPHMGHNVEDILQVIKSMEGDETVTGVNSEQPQTVEMFPINETFSSFERDLLNDDDLDVMHSLCNDNMNMGNIGNIEQVENEAQRINDNLRNLQVNAEQRLFENERRTSFLLRRLRKLQAKLVGRHVAEETTGVLESAHHSVKKYFFQEIANNVSKTVTRDIPDVGDSLSSFLGKIEKSCAVQSNSVTNRQRAVCRYFGSGSRDNSANVAVSTGNERSNANVGSSRIPIFGGRRVKVDAEEVENVAGSLAKQLHLVESQLDSDCTASSSGGESCDELQTFNNLHQQTLSIGKRASWRYAQDRASIASRWTWLQAQISDLEYKIRQHNDLQRQMRTTKGLMILENTETVNGYSGVLPGSTGRCNATETNELTTSRTRPFAWDIYRKRKLLQVDRLHEFSKRAARPSTVRCDCDHVLASCAVCTGRTDPTQSQDPIELLSIPERVARVDPCFHPVLSFLEDIPAGTHFESIMKSVDWQQKMLRGNHRMTRAKDKDSGTERRSKKQQQPQPPSQPDQRPKYASKIKKSSSSILTARIKRKMLKGKRERSGQGRASTGNSQGLSGSTTGGSRKRAAKVAPQQPEDEDDASLLSNSSKHSSPVPSPLQHHTTTANTEKNSIKEKSSNSHGRLRQNSYDIDNIVIPYSVAASTRLEKLQYKEILTPKWRLCEEPAKMDVKNGVVHRPSQDSDVEDVSEEAIALRHERSEREENKRFMTYVNMPHQGRIRHNRRADSRADSGANTPDPMSPHPSDFGGDVTSPITSPPATPSGATQDTEQNQQQQQQQHNANLESHRGSSLQNAIRRRTISTMRLVKEDTASSFAEDEHEVPPYDARTFPLTEEVYDKMLEVMPDGYWQPSTGSLCSREEEKGDDEAEMESPDSDSTESACAEVEGEDPNDPEWTVADDRDTEKERIRPTAKR